MVTKRSQPFGGDEAEFEVTAAVFNVVRGTGLEASTETYERGDTVMLNRGYANEFCKAGLLRLVQQSGSDQEQAATDVNGDGKIDQYEALGKPELQELCRAADLPTSGTKPELVERLQAHDAAQSGE